jgi:Dolichyl-phosphate-mannose-protein mannosyltransferase
VSFSRSAPQTGSSSTLAVDRAVSRRGLRSWPGGPGRGRELALFMAIALGAAVSVGLASALTPRLTLGLTMVAMAVGGLYSVIRVASPDEGERAFLRKIFLLALGLRFAVAIFTYVALPYGFFAPDETQYTYRGSQIGSAGLGSLGDITRVEGWVYLNALVAHFFGTQSELLLRLLNCLIGAMVPILCYRLAFEIAGKAAGRRAAFLTAAFPSLVLWSSLNLKDAAMHFFIVATLLIALRLQRGFSLRLVVLLGIVLALTSTLRPYLVLALLSAVVVAQLVENKNFFGSISMVIVVGAVLLVPLALWLPGFGDLYRKLASVDNVVALRGSFGTNAQSAYLATPDVQGPLDLLRFAPVAIAYFMLGPFPSLSGSILQFLTVPEMLVYYLLIPFMFVGARRALAARPTATMPVLVFTATVAVSYSLALANFGTAYRFRAQLLIVLLSLAAIGLLPRAALPLRREQPDRGLAPGRAA